MKEIEDFSDERNKAWCIHCSTALYKKVANKDHVPSKSLLVQPLPANLPQVFICKECNSSFSGDEQYLVAFLGSVLRGTTNPDLHGDSAARRILRWNSKLRDSIEQTKREYSTLGGETCLVWSPDSKRINKALIKNGRGHVYHELGEPVFGEPVHIWSRPLCQPTPSELNEFESPAACSSWPEVGSRLMTRLMSGEDMDGPWIIVQRGIYRFYIDFAGPIIVRMVLREYLAAEMVWDQ
jgi:hypothetical protein